MTGCGLLIIFISLNRIHFLIGSKFATGKVVRWRQYRAYSTPIIQFTDANYLITFAGEANTDLETDDPVTVIFKKDDPTDAQVFSFAGFVMRPMIYALIPLMLLAAAVYSFLDPRDVVILRMQSFYKIRFSKEKMLVQDVKENHKKIEQPTR